MLSRWVNRLRRAPDGDRAARHEPGAPADAPQVHVEGLLLLNLRPADGREQIEAAPPLGDRSAVVRALETAMPGMQFNACGRGRLDAADHRVTIDLGAEDPVQAAVASADGIGGIRKLSTAVVRQGWRIYVPRAGVFADPGSLDQLARPTYASREPPA